MRGRVFVAALALILAATPVLFEPTSGSPGSLQAAEAAPTPSHEPEPAPGGSGVVVVRGPYLQLGTSTGIVVRWRTDVPSSSRVLYGSSPTSLGSSASDPLLVTDHQVQLTGLAPGTTYYYAIGTTTEVLAGADANHRFATPPLTGTVQPTRIWVLGDSGTADASAAAVRDAYYGWSAGTTTNLWLMLGDNAYPLGTDAEFQQAVFSMYPEMLRRAVVWPTIGNHDLADGAAGTWPYMDIFTLPTQGQAGGVASGTESYYSFDYAQIHFIVLDSMFSDRSTNGPMLTWLEADLQSTNQDWIIAFWHHPPYSKGSHDSDDPLDSTGRLVDMRQNALPILEDYGVDLVLAGHSHSYERSYLLDGHYGLSSQIGDPTNSPYVLDSGDGSESGDGAYVKPTRGSVPYGAWGDGAVYTVAGSSGLTSGGTLDHPAMVVSLNVLGSLVLDIQAKRLDAKFLDDTGTVRDDFTILKVCLFDADKDEACDEKDNCPLDPNPGQGNADGDPMGDVCDVCPGDAGNDADNDGICAGAGFNPPKVGYGDNCPQHANPQQEDLDVDGLGNVCDPDDDGDGVADGQDSQPLNRFVCRDLDGDTCDDCTSGTANPANDGTDTDADGVCNATDTDDDGDGVADTIDSAPTNPFVCRDVDADTCDDCTSGVFSPLNDGTDTDGDGRCDAGDNCDTVVNPPQTDTNADGEGDACDPDDDGDGVDDGQDSQPLNRFICRDADGDTCEDCTSGTSNPANDGPDLDTDGLCDAGDPDVDGDGVANGVDTAPLDHFVCQDADGDTCEDCTSGTSNPANDGPDLDTDGLCNAGDPDADGDGVANTSDSQPLNKFFCLDGDSDTCDDCTSGSVNPANDGADLDADGLCNAGDTDDDGDGVADGQDSQPLNRFVCRDLDADTCDDCTSGTSNPASDGDDLDADGLCNAGDPDDDGDGVADTIDSAPTNPFVCQDADADTCDDCTSGTFDPPNDGTDTDADGRCDAGDNCDTVVNPTQTDTNSDGEGDACDTDDDGDGVADGQDSQPGNRFVCQDSDADTCDDCTSGTSNPASDGTDTDTDGLCNAGDPDDDGDGVADGQDSQPLNRFVCRDLDADTCDDCTSGTASTASDGPDLDTDGLCNAGDPDADGDGVANASDSQPLNNLICQDTDADTCDDCSSGTSNPASDGPDTDADGRCDAGDNCTAIANPAQEDTNDDGEGDACDTDDDGDGVGDTTDSEPLNRFVCQDADADTCDDCTSGTSDPANDGPDLDADGRCDADDNDDDGDTVVDTRDSDPANRFACLDVDADTCDDCTSGTFSPSADGPDFDADGRCDAGDNCFGVINPAQQDTNGDGEGDACDPDDDGDGVADGQDSAPLDRFVCQDADADTCDDCTSGTVNPTGDGTDTDADGLCNTGDPDDDGDGVADGQDGQPLNNFICQDADNDTCDDCTSGAVNPTGDGTDTDADGLCNTGDPDDDGDGVADGQDSAPLDRFVCQDADADTCDDCSSGTVNPAGDGPDLDNDGLCNAGDPDDDGDGVADGADSAPTNRFVCQDVDADTCDDCTSGTVNPAGDGTDTDGDGECNAGDNCDTVVNPAQTDTNADGEGDACDPDDDGDGVIDGQDSQPLNRFVCQDADADTCDDCTGGTVNPAADGLDTDGDGTCNAGDPDDDGDGVADGQDSQPLNRFICQDADADTCNDCVSGTVNPAADGLDTDADGLCNTGDPDDDGDGVADGQDSQPLNRFVCRDLDADGCDDCTSGTASTANDGTDTDTDGLCNTGDPDDDNDGVVDGQDSQPLNRFVCRDLDVDTCDDCTSGTVNTNADGPDFDGDGRCDAGDDDDDADGAPDGSDNAPFDPFICWDLDADTCDDCTSGTADSTADGPDLDNDGLCNAGDDDDDADGVPDILDIAPLDSNACQDLDGDTCDDCSEIPANIVQASFGTDQSGFVYLDDAFRGTSQPFYASGSYVASGGFDGGALRVVLGGIDNNTVNNMSGGWRVQFELDHPQRVTVFFRYNLTQSPHYESNEFSDALVSVDTALHGTPPNDYIIRLTGNGNGGPQITTGWNQFTVDLGTRAAGIHTVVIGTFNNTKNSSNESTTILIDDVVVVAGSGEGVADPANDGTDSDVDGLCDAGDPDDDGDGVPDVSDWAPLDPKACRDLDGDTCDDCTSGTSNPASDGTDTDADGLCNAGDPDDDGDGVADGQDSQPLNRFVCRDLDADGCDDCTSGTANPASDGTDTDGDGLCNTGDQDDDGDGVADGLDAAPQNPHACRDLDGDTCDDCVSGQDDPADDGPDHDVDGLCNAGDPDDDGDGVIDGQDSAPFDSFVCRDLDADTCDDCTSGTANPASDGTDTDADGLCNAGDPDDDGDGVADGQDSQPLNRFVCRDVDADTCDDCTSGTSNPASDGTDTDTDGLCNAGDPDDDGDGVADGQDSQPLNRFVCRDVDADTCDDCTSGTSNPASDGPDLDTDGLCNAGDPDDDGDGVADTIDSAPTNPFVCRDVDADTCDDCTSGSANPANDGPDPDTDGICDASDNCDAVANPTQTDTNSDGEGDACDTDDDGDGVADGQDSQPLNRFVCRDLDNDTCDDCTSGTSNPASDGTDTDTDGLCNAGDPDDDGDGVADGQDGQPLNRFVCQDADGDGCEDCTSGTSNPASDGTDTDADGLCDTGDPDDDGDGVTDGQDSQPLNNFVCQDADDDTCDDCTGGTSDPASDGPDPDTDGLCDAGDNCDAVANPAQTDTNGDGDGDACDPDDDGDGVADGLDSAPLDRFLCQDADGDTCDDCTSGASNPASDGTDTDTDGLCNAGDPDDDGDGVADGQDGQPLNRFVCQDADGDGCEDCTSGTSNPASDGTDTDADGLCDTGDPDDDGDGVTDGQDSQPLNHFVCRDADADTCDDCTSGSANPTNDGPDPDTDGVCDAGDNCDAVANPAQTDTNSDGEGDACDTDDDGDGVADGLDSQPLNHFVCRDLDGDACDDCTSGTSNPASDGTDTDTDGLCNAGDPDDDGDGVADGQDGQPLNHFFCQDADGDACDDCTSGSVNPASDGPDTDADGLCNAGDPDDDGDGVTDGQDSQPLNNFACQDADSDTCDDCTSGSVAPAADGPDGDGDGSCDAGDNCPAVANPEQADADSDGIGNVCDPDIDGDGVANAQDCASVVPGVSAAPGPIGDSLRLRSEGGTVLTWDRGWQGHASNVYRGAMVPDDSWTYDVECLEAQNPGTTLEDPDTDSPPVGGLFFYLVSAVNQCGESPMGTPSTGTVLTPRASCPQHDEDTDGDGLDDLADNCPLESNDQADADGDYVGNACDNCPAVPNPDQADADGNGIGNACAG